MIDNETLDLAVMLIESNPLITLNHLKNEILAVFSTKPTFSVSTLARSLQGELITLKLARDCPAEKTLIELNCKESNTVSGW